jgi:hypothetical protein
MVSSEQLRTADESVAARLVSLADNSYSAELVRGRITDYIGTETDDAVRVEFQVLTTGETHTERIPIGKTWDDESRIADLLDVLGYPPAGIEQLLGEEVVIAHVDSVSDRFTGGDAPTDEEWHVVADERLYRNGRLAHPFPLDDAEAVIRDLWDIDSPTAEPESSPPDPTPSQTRSSSPQSTTRSSAPRNPARYARYKRMQKTALIHGVFGLPILGSLASSMANTMVPPDAQAALAVQPMFTLLLSVIDGVVILGLVGGLFMFTYATIQLTERPR